VFEFLHKLYGLIVCKKRQSDISEYGGHWEESWER
jgi:hypothetical protein